ncbi:MAG: hypothetical protein II625_07180 [Bacilli bacterium]|nr:hypothetical protein [Bacilli bacterium]
MKKVKKSLILNILIVILVLLGNIFMFNGIKFMPAQDLLTATKIEMFKFYTVDSNILIGIISLWLIIYECLLLRKKINKIPERVYILKLLGTAGIMLTFLVTLVFLTPRYGFYAMYNNSNLFFHLIVPLLALTSYVFFEKHNNKLKNALYGLLPMIIYSIYYTGAIIAHLKTDGLSYKYDFYGFLGGKMSNIIFALPIIYLITYLISLIIVFLNKKLAK